MLYIYNITFFATKKLLKDIKIMSDEYDYTAIEWFRNKPYRKPKKIIDMKVIANRVHEHNKAIKEELIRLEKPKLSASVISKHIGEAGYKGASMYQLGLSHPLVVRVKEIHRTHKRKQIADELAPKILNKFIEDMED